MKGGVDVNDDNSSPPFLIFKRETIFQTTLEKNKKTDARGHLLSSSKGRERDTLYDALNEIIIKGHDYFSDLIAAKGQQQTARLLDTITNETHGHTDTDTTHAAEERVENGSQFDLTKYK